jgi:hypothetical protein
MLKELERLQVQGFEMKLSKEQLRKHRGQV